MKISIYDQVTERIINLLQQGVAPWKSPYLATIGFPRNFSTQKNYQGINVFLLACHRFTSPWFLTYLQARELGGNVRKGEKGFLVVKYGNYVEKVENPASPEEAEIDHPYLKGYTVFNSSQIDGIAFPAPEIQPQWTEAQKCARAREIVAGMPKAPTIKEGLAIPCYRPRTDTVHMPEARYFSNEEARLSTLFHELSHATGHLSRLARRSLIKNKGIQAGGTARKIYAEEELVAEMAASFLNAHAGIIETEIENTAAYLQGWIKALQGRDAKTWIVKAASEAQKAADYILNVDRKNSE